MSGRAAAAKGELKRRESEEVLKGTYFGRKKGAVKPPVGGMDPEVAKAPIEGRAGGKGKKGPAVSHKKKEAVVVRDAELVRRAWIRGCAWNVVVFVVRCLI